MSNLYRRKLDKIYTKIDKIAVKGKEGSIEYYRYIDELIEKGDYGFFEQVMVTYYEIDILDMTVDQVKNQTWEPILFQTTTPFLKKLGRMYKRRGVYQDSFYIHNESPDITQIDLSEPLSSTYSTTGTTQLPTTSTTSFF